jgi:hypothetical protein
MEARYDSSIELPSQAPGKNEISSFWWTSQRKQFSAKDKGLDLEQE